MSRPFVVTVTALTLAQTGMIWAQAPHIPSPTRSPATVERILRLSPEDRRMRLQRVLDAYHNAGLFSGGVLAADFTDGTIIDVATGFADRERRTPMPTDAPMLVGSAGQTFFTALALRLVAEGQLDLDEPIATYLKRFTWLPQLPNANRVTSRMLLNQTSGYGSYDVACFHRLKQDLLRGLSPLGLGRCLLDMPPLFEPGTRFQFSDLATDVLATIVETITQQPAYAEIKRQFLDPLGLQHTTPADRARLPGLVPGYDDRDSATMRGDSLVRNPVFEWAGGGFVSTAGDLARWMAAYRCGDAFPISLWPTVTAGVDASSIPQAPPGLRFGLGIGIEQTPEGLAYGHGGVADGYSTRMRWYEDLGIALAIEVNTNNMASLPGWAEGTVLDEAAAELAKGR